jgi:hypothetical protein
VSVATGPTASAPLLVASAGAGGATGVDAGQVKPPPTTLVISPTTTARSMNPPKVATRDVVLTRINPPRALVSVDEAPPVDVEAGRTFTFDVSPHSLVFSCPKDLEGNSLCEPRTVRVPPGPVAPDPLIIRLNIKDAFLQVEGDPNKHYVIKEDSKHVIVGEDTPVKMVESASRIVHVTELETDRNQTVQLRAGKHATASFLGP